MSAGIPYSSSKASFQAFVPAPPLMISVPSMSKRIALMPAGACVAMSGCRLGLSGDRHQDVGQPEAAGLVDGKSRRPFRSDGPERLRVGVDDAHENLADDPSSDRAQPVAPLEGLCLLENVEPQRCLV